MGDLFQGLIIGNSGVFRSFHLPILVPTVRTVSSISKSKYLRSCGGIGWVNYWTIRGMTRTWLSVRERTSTYSVATSSLISKRSKDCTSQNHALTHSSKALIRAYNSPVKSNISTWSTSYIWVSALYNIVHAQGRICAYNKASSDSISVRRAVVDPTAPLGSVKTYGIL